MIVYPTSYIYGVGLSTMPKLYIQGDRGNQEVKPFYGWYTSSQFTQPVTSISKTNIGTVILYAKYDLWVSSMYASYTNTVTSKNPADGPSKEFSIMLNSYYYDEVEPTTLKNIAVTISLDLWEIKDGYQHLYLYDDNGTERWHTEIEHGPGSTNTQPGHYTYTVVFSIEELKAFDFMELRFAATGWFGNDWQFEELEVDVYLTN